MAFNYYCRLFSLILFSLALHLVDADLRSPTMFTVASQGVGSNLLANSPFLPNSVNNPTIQCPFPLVISNGKCTCLGIFANGQCQIGNVGSSSVLQGLANLINSNPVNPSSGVSNTAPLTNNAQNSNNALNFPPNPVPQPVTPIIPTFVPPTVNLPIIITNPVNTGLINNTRNTFAVLISNLKQITRNIDGSFNNAFQTSWGSTNQNQLRKSPATFSDGISSLMNGPSPRVVSNLLSTISGNAPSRKNINMMFVTFGQFLDHDMVFTPTNSDVLNMPVPRCDTTFDQFCTGNSTLPWFRTLSSSPSGITKQIVNQKTAWIDASHIYGVDQLTSDSLRSFTNGKLKTSSDNVLPSDANGKLFVGDHRGGQNAALTALHTLFLREHNRLCNRISNENPNLSDQEIYQSAKNYVIGLIQKIALEDYLPLAIGQNAWKNLVGNYNGYSNNVNPTIRAQFSTAAFRYGHCLINNPLQQVDSLNRVVKTFKMTEIFNRPSLITNQSLDLFLRGMAATRGKEMNFEMIDDFRSLFMSSINFSLDLFAFDIVRGRDHGMADYNTVRRSFGLKPLQNFDQLTSLSQKSISLTSLYGTPDSLDLFVGLAGENSLVDGVVGELGAAILSDQFKSLRDGDSLWYEHAYPLDIVNEIKQTSLSDIIIRNSGISTLSSNAFLAI